MRFEETAATIGPFEVWQVADNSVTGTELSGGQAFFTDAAGATATFTFTGTGVSWIGLTCDICGIAEVQIDGALVAEVDAFSATTAPGVLLDSQGLAPGDHTLTITVTGRTNAPSGGAFVVVDAFEVTN